MTTKNAIEYNKNLREYMRITDKDSEYKFLKENYEALDMGIKSIEVLDKLESIIVDQLDKSTDSKECMTLRWVLDKIAEASE